MQSLAAASGRSGNCFSCKKEGHWSRDCPHRRRSSSSSSSTGRKQQGTAASDDSSHDPVLHCANACGPIRLQTSHTSKNPGRKFYRCGVPDHSSGKECRYFRWFDEVISSLQSNRPVDVDPVYPNCPCGAGWCLRKTVDAGEHAGRKYFCCPGKTTVCDFSKWCDDESLDSKHDGASSINQDVFGVSQQSPMCTCGAGKCRLNITETDKHSYQLYFACPVLKNHGACNFIQPINLRNNSSMDDNDFQEHTAFDVTGQASGMMNDNWDFPLELIEDLLTASELGY